MENVRIILCIDDDEDDLEMLHHAFLQLAPHYSIITAKSGESGIAILQNLASENRLPSLIVLDINMPRMDGRETFMNIRAQETFKEIPIVIFSTSSSLMDKNFFYKMNVSYFVKPVDLDQFKQVVHQLLKHCR